MKFIFIFILALMTVVRGDSSGEEVKAFWERELQSSVTGNPTGAPIGTQETNPPTRTPTVTPATASPTQSPNAAPVITTPAPVVTTPAPVVTKPAPVVTTASPTVSAAPSFNCNVDPVQRRAQIISILGGVSEPVILSTTETPQNNAAEWLIGTDEFAVCPGDEKLIQRYVMALFYYSTSGDSWTQCSAGDVSCTAPNVPFLAPVNECGWFGLSCDADLCITEIIFESNNVAGTIPFELEQLEGLQVISLEQGTLTSTIPTSLGTLTNLRPRL